MDIHFDFDREDLVEYNQHVHLSPAIRRKRLAGLLRLAVIFLLTGSCLLFTGSPLLAPFGWGLIGASAVVSILSLLLDRVIMRRQIEKLIPRAAMEAIYGPKRLKLDSEGLSLAGELVVTSCKWQAIERIDLSDSQVLFFYSPIHAVVVPCRAFASGAELNQFVETAQRLRHEALEWGTPSAPDANSQTR